MHTTRLELARVAPYAPQAYVSAIPPRVQLLMYYTKHELKRKVLQLEFMGISNRKIGFFWVVNGIDDIIRIREGEYETFCRLDFWFEFIV